MGEAVWGLGGASTPRLLGGKRKLSAETCPDGFVGFFVFVFSPLQLVQFQNPKTCPWLPSAGAWEVLPHPCKASLGLGIIPQPGKVQGTNGI